MFEIRKRIEERFGFTKEERDEKNIKIRKRIEERKRAHLDIFIKMMIFILMSLYIIHYNLEIHPKQPIVFVILVLVVAALVYAILGYTLGRAFVIGIFYDKYAKDTDELIREESKKKS